MIFKVGYALFLKDSFRQVKAKLQSNVYLEPDTLIQLEQAHSYTV